MTTPHDRTFHNGIGDIVRAWAAQQSEYEARLNEKRVECDELHDRLIEAQARCHAAELRYAELVEVVVTRTAQAHEPTVPKDGHCGARDEESKS